MFSSYHCCCEVLRGRRVQHSDLLDLLGGSSTCANNLCLWHYILIFTCLWLLSLTGLQYLYFNNKLCLVTNPILFVLYIWIVLHHMNLNCSSPMAAMVKFSAMRFLPYLFYQAEYLFQGSLHCKSFLELLRVVKLLYLWYLAVVKYQV